MARRTEATDAQKLGRTHRPIPVNRYLLDTGIAGDFVNRRGRVREHALAVDDIQIAAVALTLPNCVVVTKDSDLRAVPGLKTEDGPICKVETSQRGQTIEKFIWLHVPSPLGLNSRFPRPHPVVQICEVNPFSRRRRQEQNRLFYG